MGLCTSVTANEDRREKKTREGGAGGRRGREGNSRLPYVTEKNSILLEFAFFSAEYFLAS